MRASILSPLLAVLATACAGAQGVSVSMHIELRPNPQARHAAAMKMRSAGPPQIIAWLTPVGATEPAAHPPTPAHSYTLIQKDKQFSPHLLVVPTGASVEFPNLDPFFHNVFSLYNGRRFDLGLYEAGSRRSVRFDHDGISYIFCNIHPEMAAVVISLSTPYFGVAGKDGSVLLSNVPPGVYELNLWSENVAPSDLASARQRLQVGTQNLHLPSVSLSEAPSLLDQHMNKFGETYKHPEQAPY